MENDNLNREEKRQWRIRFILVLTLVDIYLWFFIIPQFLKEELGNPWISTFYYFVIPAIWLVYAWRFISGK